MAAELLTAIALGNAGYRSANFMRACVPLEASMDSIIYLVGLIVIVMAILSFFGLH